MKKGKAAEEDELRNEVWLWRGRGLKKTLWEICKKVWRREDEVLEK